MCVVPASHTPLPALVTPHAMAAEVINIDTRVSDIADAIYGAEGRCSDLYGESGEYGCYQYQPTTWVSYSKQATGEVLPQTAENERHVTEYMIESWLESGVSERGIFLTWNQGDPGPDCYKGVNRWGVPYDSCAYADKAMELLKERQITISTSEVYNK